MTPVLLETNDYFGPLEKKTKGSNFPGMNVDAICHAVNLASRKKLLATPTSRETHEFPKVPA